MNKLEFNEQCNAIIDSKPSDISSVTEILKGNRPSYLDIFCKYSLKGLEKAYDHFFDTHRDKIAHLSKADFSELKSALFLRALSITEHRGDDSTYRVLSGKINQYMGRE